MILWFSECSYLNKNLVGGKNASLGELYRLSQRLEFNISNGFAITTQLYQEFLQHNRMLQPIQDLLSHLDRDSQPQHGSPQNLETLQRISDSIQNLFQEASFSNSQQEQIQSFYRDLSGYYHQQDLAVAVRSSALAEDLPNASFAGQQDTFLNVSGLDQLLQQIKHCFASLFNARAISYRQSHNIKLEQVLISVGVQKMIRSDLGTAGVAFSVDPETGYSKAIVVNAAWGLGELVVSGGVNPDEWILDKRVLSLPDKDPIIAKKLGSKEHKTIYDGGNGITEVVTSEQEQATYSLDDQQVVQLARIIASLEREYQKLLSSSKPQQSVGIDVEWAWDGSDKTLYILQTRPETVHANRQANHLIQYQLNPVDHSQLDLLLIGVAVGEKISSGSVNVLASVKEYRQFNPGDILVTEMTTPDWEPIMKQSSGIVTSKGGRTCHAAIVARELGINAVVGTGVAVESLHTGQEVTLNCAEGDQAKVYAGLIPYSKQHFEVDLTQKLPVKLMLNVGSPESAFAASLLPHSGVGLARLEFIISNYVQIHPLALADYPNLSPDVSKEIYQVIADPNDDPNNPRLGADHFIKRLGRGMARIASAFYPQEVIVRLSDFKSNEYKNLVGGELYEPVEENPMIGWRGASRYYSEEYQRGFELECQAISYVRNIMSMSNVIVMIPFCRTPQECQRVIEIMAKYGLVRGQDGLQIYLMCEIPSNVIEADNFSRYVDGVSIGGNDLLQLTLGVDRDSEKVASLSDDHNVSYRRMISQAIQQYKQRGVKVGFCGQQPSDSVEFCHFLIQEGVDSISVTPDSVLKTIYQLRQLTIKTKKKQQ